MTPWYLRLAALVGLGFVLLVATRASSPRAMRWMQLLWTLWLAEGALTWWMHRPAAPLPFAPSPALPPVSSATAPESLGAVAEDRPTVVFLGDSFTYGDGVASVEAFPHLVGEAMPDVRVVNHGAAGLSFFDEMVMYAAVSSSLKPDVVVWVWTLNDLGNPQMPAGLHPERDRPVAWGPWLFEIPRTAWWRHRVGRIMSDGYPEMMTDREKSARAEELLTELAHALHARGAHLVVTAFPLLHQLDDYPFLDVHDHLREMTERAGAIWVDLVPPFVGREASSLWVHPSDHHPNPEGHRLATPPLVEALQQLEIGGSGPVDCDRLPVIPDLEDRTRAACRSGDGPTLLRLAEDLARLPQGNRVESPLGVDAGLVGYLAVTAAHRSASVRPEAEALIRAIQDGSIQQETPAGAAPTP